MMNVGENLAQNGVLDSPESKNEEKLLSIGRLDPSRYAMEGLRILRGTRWLQNIKDSSGNLRGTRSLLGLPPRYATGEAVEKSDFLYQIACRTFYFLSSRVNSTQQTKNTHFHHLNLYLKPQEVKDRTRDHLNKS